MDEDILCNPGLECGWWRVVFENAFRFCGGMVVCLGGIYGLM